MLPLSPAPDRRRFAKQIGLTALFNTGIAIVLTFFWGRTSLGNYLVLSQATGLCICLFCQAGLRLLRRQTLVRLLTMFTVAIVAGTGLGGVLGGWLTGLPLLDMFNDRAAVFRSLLLSLLFSSLIIAFFLSRRTLDATRLLVQQERLQRLASEKLAAQAQLALLQAQIEPHFLFNTLANILSLLETDLASARAMLTDLTLFLRASLEETRAPWTTLGGELGLVNAYLNIQKIRMGPRLQVRCEVDDRLRQIPFAPMLLQPLVENAVLHGLDPLVEGGSILISAELAGETLRVRVMDTGQGFGDHPAIGLGITNVRERLNALYGPAGRLLLAEHHPQGLEAVIEVPCAPGT